MTASRTPAEVFHVGEHIQDELNARGWTVADLASRMLGSAVVNELCLHLLIDIRDKNLLLSRETAEQIGKAFGVEAEYWMRLDQSWRERQP